MVCQRKKSLGPRKRQGVYLSPEWCAHTMGVSGDKRGTQLTSLRMKIWKQVESHAHKLAESVLNQKDQNNLKATMENAVTSWVLHLVLQLVVRMA